MTPEFIQAFANDTIWTMMLVSAPVLGVALVVGLSVSIFQATTQINEMTLAYIPKIVSIYVTLIVFGGFIMSRLMTYASGIFSDFTRFTK